MPRKKLIKLSLFHESQLPPIKDELPEELEQAENLRAFIREALRQLPKFERQVIRAKFFKKKPTSREQIASRYAVSRETIRRAESRGLSKLKEVLETSFHFKVD